MGNPPNIFQINPPKFLIPLFGHFKIFILLPSAKRWGYIKPNSDQSVNTNVFNSTLPLRYINRPVHSKFEKQHKIYSCLDNPASQKKTTKALMLFLCKVLN